MRFSILVPVYNVEKYLRACIESILRQTFSDYELILVDDGSKDSSGTICDAYAAQYANCKVLHQENQGLVSARRTGLKNASGEYCIFCDSDDYLEPGALEQLNTVIEEHHADVVLYNAQCDADGVKTPFFTDVFPQGLIGDKKEMFDMLLLSYKINALWVKACKRDLIDIDTDYSDYYRCNFGEDLLQSIPILKRAKRVYYLNRILYNYRVATGMMSKFSPHYYWSYRKVNGAVTQALAECSIADLKQKTGVHLLVAAYGATTQLKYAQTFDTTYLSQIADDPEFRCAYETVRRSGYWKKLNKKQRLLLPTLYRKWFFAMKMLLSLKKKGKWK